MKHMKYLLAAVFSTVLLSTMHAQKHEYDDLLVLYVDEEYEKCLSKAERYTDREKTRRDALPYLYMSMCFYEISKLEEYRNEREWRRADRDALKYARRFRKKDKDLEYFHQFGDYWEALNTMAMETGMMYLDLEEFSKAKRYFDKMTDYYPENPGAWQMLALSQSKLNMAREAMESMKQFQKAYDSLEDINDLPRDQRILLRNSLIAYTQYLEEKGDLDDARATLEMGVDDFMDNAEFNSLYQVLN